MKPAARCGAPFPGTIDDPLPLDRSLPDVLERFIEVGAASPKGACDAGEPKHLSPRSHDSLSPACRVYANYHCTNKLQTVC